MPDTSPSPVVLTIAGFDPSSGAGITADLKTLLAHGLFGVSCITALTVQSTLGVKEVIPLAAEYASRTLSCLSEDMGITGVKIGMLATGEMVSAVADFLSHARIPRDRIVLDPVIRSSSGAALLDIDGLARMRDDLLPRVGWITPNTDELGALIEREIHGYGDAEAGAKRLQDGQKGMAIVVTGGDLERPDEFYLAATGDEGSWIHGERIETSATHGTGCAFSSALMAQLVLGQSGMEAVKLAKQYVAGAMRTAIPIGKGRGPINHQFRTAN